MDKVWGKYLNQTDNDFPLDCETFDYIQKNSIITEMIGNIAGDKTFIYGCEKTGSTYSSGYVFLKTPLRPEGEILPFGGGGASSGKVYIDSQDISVTANGKTYSAYTKRSLSLVPTSYDRTGYNLNEFTYASYNKPMYGEIKIWSGPIDELPPGYHLCDGSELKKSEYPNLYNVIGTMYNNQHIGSSPTYTNSDFYTTRDGYFRIPDLTGRFIVGTGSDEKIPGDSINGNGYNYGSQGGISVCTLTSKQSGLLNHDHGAFSTCNSTGDHRHWYAADDEAQNITGYGLGLYVEKHTGPGDRGAGGVQQSSSAGSHYHTIETTVYRSGEKDAISAHENKPPFMVLAYIIRIS